MFFFKLIVKYNPNIYKQSTAEKGFLLHFSDGICLEVLLNLFSYCWNDGLRTKDV